MDKLEQYLDQVCRGIGGPREMRQHVRQELREHLLDAAARHKAAGLPEDRALDQALADFGQPDEVRSGLEEAHGHRLMGVVIDKALDWKEKTMRAKWLWATWAYVALAVVIVLEVVFLTGAEVFLIPKIKKILQDIGVGPGSQLYWVRSVFISLDWVADNATWCLLLAAAVWALFEWRVRSENKSLMRLSAFLTAAVGLMGGIMFTAAAMVIPLLLLMPDVLKRAGL
jgi:type II secretory pathway component PulF